MTISQDKSSIQIPDLHVETIHRAHVRFHVCFVIIQENSTTRLCKIAKNNAESQTINIKRSAIRLLKIRLSISRMGYEYNSRAIQYPTFIRLK